MHEFGWSPDDHDRMAAGVVAGHINECGAQATAETACTSGGPPPDIGRGGISHRGGLSGRELVVTKHPGTGGRVSLATLKEQIVYEMGDPSSYITPDVVGGLHHHPPGGGRSRPGPGFTGGEGEGGHRVPPRCPIAYADGFKAAGTLVLRLARRGGEGPGRRADPPGATGPTWDSASMRSAPSWWDGTPPHGQLAGEPPAEHPRGPLRVAPPPREGPGTGLRVERFSREIAPPGPHRSPPPSRDSRGDAPPVQEVMAYWPALIRKEAVEPHLAVSLLEV